MNKLINLIIGTCAGLSFSCFHFLLLSCLMTNKGTHYGAVGSFSASVAVERVLLISCCVFCIGRSIMGVNQPWSVGV